MSRIDELKKQNPLFGVNLIDIINNFVSKPKYTEMLVNLIKNKFESQESHHRDIRNELVREYNIPESKVDSMSYFELQNSENSDLTSYKTFQELELQMSLADLKMVDKEMEKQIEKLFEDEQWLVLKPLSYLSSKKYGASTKWCTASDKEPDYYYRYVKRGILIYAINKKTGDKVAGFKNIDTSYERETSFWNITDQRIDSLETGLPNHIMDIFRDQFHNTKVSNWDSLTDDERNRQLLWLENEYYGMKKSRSDEVEAPRAIGENMARPLRNIGDVLERLTETMDMTEEEPQMEMMMPQTEMITEEYQPRAARLIQMYPDEGPNQAG